MNVITVNSNNWHLGALMVRISRFSVLLEVTLMNTSANFYFTIFVSFHSMRYFSVSQVSLKDVGNRTQWVSACKYQSTMNPAAHPDDSPNPQLCAPCLHFRPPDSYSRHTSKLDTRPSGYPDNWILECQSFNSKWRLDPVMICDSLFFPLLLSLSITLPPTPTITFP